MKKIIEMIPDDIPDWARVAIEKGELYETLLSCVRAPDELTASEALCGFCAWLASREEKITMSSTDSVAPIAPLIEQFCKEHHLSSPRDGWSGNLSHPNGEYNGHKDKIEHTDNDAKELLESMHQLEKDYAPNKYPPVRMSVISTLCNIAENMVPSIDLLQTRMERGEYLKRQDGKWWLFQKDGEGIFGEKTLRGILLGLIWRDC